MPTEDRQSFMDRVAHLPRHEVLQIDMAYDMAKSAHRNQTRDTGERYFEHARAVALILMDECDVIDANVISVALLHDAGEDSVMLGNHRISLPGDCRPRYEQWQEVVKFRLMPFDSFVAEGVIALTKPEVDGVYFRDKLDAANHYLEGLWQAHPQIVLVKMADRLHNLRSLAGNTPEKQQKTVLETREVYMPLFTDRALQFFYHIGGPMLDKIELEMAKYPVG